MNHRDRLQQLRGLLDRLERMPQSADRDWMLAEVRRRAVDVESGIPLTPMRAMPQDELEAERSAAVVKQPRKSSRPAQRPRPVRAPARVPPAPLRERELEDVVDLLERGGLLSLDDSPAPASDASRPWSKGLRS
jgi:hypothetical protein